MEYDAAAKLTFLDGTETGSLSSSPGDHSGFVEAPRFQWMRIRAPEAVPSLARDRGSPRHDDVVVINLMATSSGGEILIWLQNIMVVPLELFVVETGMFG